MKINKNSNKVNLDKFLMDVSKDIGLKQRLISNPKETIEFELDVRIESNDTKIVVEDQSNSSIIYLNIPRRISITDLEFSDEYLDKISGGLPGFGCTVAGVVMTITVVAAANHIIGEFSAGWNSVPTKFT